MKFKSKVKITFSLFVLLLISMTTILFFVLYLSTFDGGFFFRNKSVLLFCVTVCVCVISILSLIFMVNDNKFIYKLTILVLSFIAIAFSVLYLLKVTGIYSKIHSVEDLRNYVASFGYMAVIIYVVMNFLQVVILPIPGFIAVGTGVALFGPFKTSVFSLIGILSGSLLAFFIGRYFGYKVVSWLIGKEELDKWLKHIENKDKIILTFMFLFPFFPDDVLCFVAGLSSMSNGYFVIMILVCRIISVFTSAYSMNGNIIPFNTWWGITLWVILIIFTIAFTVLLYKKGDDVENFFKDKLRRRNR